MSKKEAIDLLTYVRDGLAEERGSDYSGVEAMQMAINAFEQLETHDKRTETHSCDLISRQALCEYALNQKDKSVTPNDIMRFPSAEPEIIRCKDCKHYDGRPCGKVDWYNSADDFCSKAERKDA